MRHSLGYTAKCGARCSLIRTGVWSCCLDDLGMLIEDGKSRMFNVLRYGVKDGIDSWKVSKHGILAPSP